MLLLPRGSLVRWGIPLLACGLFGFAVVSVLTHPARGETEPALAAPSTPFPAAVAGVGVIEPRGEAIAIGTNLPGIVAAVQVAAGQQVEAGAPLFTIDDRAARAALALAETQLDEARARVASVRTELEQLTVTSPIAGRVWRVNMREGEFAQAGPLAEPLLVLGDDSLLHVRVEIDQTDAHRVSGTAPAVGSLRGDGGRQVDLAFVRFEPLVQPKRALTGDGTERVDTRVLEVVYALPEDGLRAFVGQQMDVFIEAEALGLEGAARARPAAAG
jgi:multidrug efflux pump subunit AcrA (membrane-fusion protein)